MAVLEDCEVTIALPQRDNYIEAVRRIEGLMEYAEQIGDWEEQERLKERLNKLQEKM